MIRFPSDVQAMAVTPLLCASPRTNFSFKLFPPLSNPYPLILPSSQAKNTLFNSETSPKEMS